jgi:hypothetical protein
MHKLFLCTHLACLFCFRDLLGEEKPSSDLADASYGPSQPKEYTKAFAHLFSLSRRAFRSGFGPLGFQILAQLVCVTMFIVLRYAQIVLMYSSSLPFLFQEFAYWKAIFQLGWHILRTVTAQRVWQKKLCPFVFCFSAIWNPMLLFISSNITYNCSSTHWPSLPTAGFRRLGTPTMFWPGLVDICLHQFMSERIVQDCFTHILIWAGRSRALMMFKLLLFPMLVAVDCNVLISLKT